MTKIVFVGGTGRSGTSIVKEILANHSGAASLPFEYRFIIDPDGLIDFYASYTAVWSPYIADRKLKNLECFLETLAHEPLHHRIIGRFLRRLNRDGKILSPRKYHGWELNQHLPNYAKHVQNLISKLVQFSFPACWVGTASYSYLPQVYHASPKTKEELASILGDFIQNVVGDFVAQSGKSFFVEDNTWNIFFAKEIIELVPEAKIIHVYRDPRDVVASFSHQRWSPTDKIQGACWYQTMMDRWFALRSLLPGNCYIEVKLEDLVSHPKDVLLEICRFLGISLEQGMLQVDLGHAHQGRWMQEFTLFEKEKVQAILGDIIVELGYDLIDDPKPK
jgi:hypothetical protein